jgi:PAS domain S-box-containing protein
MFSSRKTLFRLCLLAVAIVLLLAASAWTLLDLRDTARRQAEQQEKTILLAMQDDISGAIGNLDQSLQSALRGMAIPNLADLGPALRQAILFNAAANLAGTGGVVIADETGQLVYDSFATPARAVNIFDRDYFQALRDHADPGLVIVRPARSRFNGQWTVALARRINHKDGSFAGAAVIALELDFFQHLFSKLDIGRDGSIALFSTDGLLLTRRPFQPQYPGRDLSASALFSALARAPTGTFDAVDSLDGIRRLSTYARIGDQPFVAVVGLPDSDIYADWVGKTAVLCAVLLLLALIGSSLALAWGREFERRGRAEQAARHSESTCAEALARLDTLFENSADIMLVARAEPDGGFVYEAVNPVWESVSGMKPAMAIGQSPTACLPAELAGQVMQAWADCVRERQPVRLKYSTNLRRQTRRWDALIIPVVSKDGVVRRLIAVARDVTEQELLEAELRQAQRMEAVGQLTAGVAHDFNNILQGILGAMELLGEQPELHDDGRDLVDVTRSVAQRGATLVHRLLAFSRKQPLRPEVLKPEAVVAQLTALAERVLGGHIRLETSVTKPAWAVCADNVQLQNCLLNLAINARDAMPDGGTIRLRVANAEAGEAQSAGLPPGDYTCFAVEDDGAGMSPETLARALEPFFTTKPLGQGTGLGLPMVQGFARQSGGDVRIDSVPGRGTRVCLFLPRVAEPEPRSAEQAAYGSDGVDHGRGRVLVVDDEPAVRHTLSLYLARAGFATVTAEDGQQALDRLRTKEYYDLLITDQSMPGVTGSELIAEASRLRPDLPTMLITGYDKVRGLDELVGRVTVLRKPFEMAHLLRQVHALLDVAANDIPVRTEPSGQQPDDGTRGANVFPFRGGPGT